MSLNTFVDWLAATGLSKTIGDHAWITPSVQTVHILAICVIMSAVLLTNLRALNVVGREETLLRFSDRYGPWIIAALLVLALSGSMLIVGEPKRSLENVIFWTKMGLLAVALAATATILLPLRRDSQFWVSPGRSAMLKGLSLGSLAVWAGIIFAGRWIAYAVT